MDKRIGAGFTNPVETGEVLDVCLCFGCGGVGGWLGQGSGVMLCCESVFLVNMAGLGICILC